MPTQNFDQLHGQIDATVHTDGPTGKTTAAGLNALLHRLVTDLPAGPALPADQVAALDAAPNPSAANPYATRADLAAVAITAAGNSVIVEQDLSSNSTTSVPSVVAVKLGLDKAFLNKLDSLKATYLDNKMVTYRIGQAPDYSALDILQAYNSDHTPHDLIVVQGLLNAPLCLRNQDYSVRGYQAVANGGFLGAATLGRKIEVDGVSFTSTLHIFESTDDGTAKGHDITVYNSPFIVNLGVFQGANGGHRDVHKFINCNVGNFFREAAYCGSPGHVVYFDKCRMGVGITSGSIFGQLDASNLKIVVTNTTITLAGTATLHPDPANPIPASYLFFQNCTLIAADGTVTALDSAGGGSTTATASSTKGGDYTLQATDAGTIVPFSAAALCTIPPGVFAVGQVVELMSYGAFSVTVVGGANVTVAAPTGNLTPAADGGSVRLWQRSPDNWVLTGGVK